MKSLLMVFFLMGGLAISNAYAQACAPCPPGCCVAACISSASADASAKQTLLPGTTAFAACSPEQIAVCESKMAACEGKKMSKKEMKDCQAVCQSIIAAATPTGQSKLVAQPACGRKPAPAVKTSKQ